MDNINKTLSLLPYKKSFVKSRDFNENARIFTFAIGSNNNIRDWNKFLESNINRALISKQKAAKSSLKNTSKSKYVNEKNINSFKKCLKFVDEGKIKDHYLTFSSYSFKRGGCGVASLSYSKNALVEGCIFELISDGFISKREIINLIRWKEDFPYFYKEVFLPVIGQDGTKYNCFLYVINSSHVIDNLNNTFPILPLPPSNYYIKLVLESHKKFDFDKKWLNIVEKIVEKASYYRGRFNKHINTLFTSFNENPNHYKLLKYIKRHYKNNHFRSFRLANNNEYELFKIYTLLGCQMILFSSKNAVKDSKISDIIKQISPIEFRPLLRILNMLLIWDTKIKNLQS